MGRGPRAGHSESEEPRRRDGPVPEEVTPTDDDTPNYLEYPAPVNWSPRTHCRELSVTVADGTHVGQSVGPSGQRRPPRVSPGDRLGFQPSLGPSTDVARCGRSGPCPKGPDPARGLNLLSFISWSGPRDRTLRTPGSTRPRTVMFHVLTRSRFNRSLPLATRRCTQTRDRHVPAGTTRDRSSSRPESEGSRNTSKL